MGWAWKDIFGENDKKQYDNLILLGELDMNYISSYRKPLDQFIIFNIPFKKAVYLTSGKSSIYATTDPKKTRKYSMASQLFKEYQMTPRELKKAFKA
jgi:hypothetical protein